MKREFAKLHGLGNDFVFFDDMENTMNLSDDQVKSLCDRHFGIGADGVILVRPPKTPGALAYMHYINSDGSLAQMCGNGVRCFAKYLVDYGYADASGSLIVDTMAGPKPITYTTDANGLLALATVDMGRPILDPKLVPVNAPVDAVSDSGEGYVRNLAIASPWGTFRFTCVSMGNPHAVCILDDWENLSDELFSNEGEKNLASLDLDRIGAYFETHPVFPEKTNVEFATTASDGIHMRVFERGCGETLACGTGACATSVAAALSGWKGRESDVHLLGGALHVSWGENGHVLMTGPAQLAFTGSVEIEVGCAYV